MGTNNDSDVVKKSLFCQVPNVCMRVKTGKIFAFCAFYHEHGSMS